METGLLAWLKKLFTPLADQKDTYQTGWEAHPTLIRQLAGSVDYGGGGIGMRRLTHPSRGGKLTKYRYWCACGTELTDGPSGGCAVNAVCETCKLNYGNLPGYWGA